MLNLSKLASAVVVVGWTSLVVTVPVLARAVDKTPDLERSISMCRASLTPADWAKLAPVVTPENLETLVTQLATDQKSDLTQALLEECLYRNRAYFRFCAIHINEMAIAAAHGTLCSLTSLSVTPTRRP